MKEILVAMLFAAAAFAAPLFAKDETPMPGSNKPAIVLAAFGTSDPEAVQAILAIKARVESAFPDYDVFMGFTSNIIRKIWHERAGDEEFRKENPELPAELYRVTNVISALAAAQEEGFRPVLVQSLHVTDGEEFSDLKELVEVLGGYTPAKARRKPFPAIGVGAPALGVGDGQENSLRRAAEALEDLAAKAEAAGAALVLMAHGNEDLTQTVFSKFERMLRDTYGPWIYIGLVEASPLAEEVIEAVKRSPDAPRKVLLAPLMVVAGEHARNDMAGDEEDSWLTLFREEGFEVDCHVEGLGLNPSWAEIYVEHLKELEKALIQ